MYELANQLVIQILIIYIYLEGIFYNNDDIIDSASYYYK